MATVMGATYPDVFAAVGVHSGLPAHSATDVISAFAAMRGDGPTSPQRSGRVADARVRTIIFHGSADATVHASNATKILEGTRRARDTSKMQSGSIAGRGFDRTTVHDAQGLKWLEQWILHGAGHAWSGGSVAGSCTDATGPDASREMVRFFLER
jgi:poly(3-hydroxybutyrate) depolymerase